MIFINFVRMRWHALHHGSLVCAVLGHRLGGIIVSDLQSYTERYCSRCPIIVVET